MAATRTTVAVGGLAFLAGVLLSSAFFVTRDDRAPFAPEGRNAGDEDTGPASVERRPRADPAGVTIETLGEPATEEELSFLRQTLVAERQRRAEAAVAEEVRERESKILAEDHGLAITRRYLDHGADVSSLVSDYKSMRSHIRTSSGPIHRVDATGPRTPVDLSKLAETVTVLEFGDGVFVLDRGNSSWNSRSEVVESLEIRGAGMDRTTLIGPGWAFLYAGGEGQFRNLVIRDLTIDSVEKSQIVLAARSGIAAALERVRIAGWVVAGHAAALGVSGHAYLACRECEFVGAGNGWVLSLRGPALAVFEKCRFADANAVLIAGGGDRRPSVVHLNDCVFEDVRLSDRGLWHDGKGGADVVIRGGRAAVGPASWGDEQRHEHFGVDEAVSMEGFTFTTSAPLFSPDQAADALRLAAAAGLHNLLALDAYPAGSGRPVEIDFYTLAEKAGQRPDRHTRLFDGGRLFEPEEGPRRGLRGASDLTAGELAGTLALADLVRRAKIAADETVKHVRLLPGGKLGEGETARRQVTVFIELAGQHHVVLDAETGKELSRR